MKIYPVGYISGCVCVLWYVCVLSVLSLGVTVCFGGQNYTMQDTIYITFTRYIGPPCIGVVFLLCGPPVGGPSPPGLKVVMPKDCSCVLAVCVVCVDLPAR